MAEKHNTVLWGIGRGEGVGEGVGEEAEAERRGRSDVRVLAAGFTVLA